MCFSARAVGVRFFLRSLRRLPVNMDFSLIAALVLMLYASSADGCKMMQHGCLLERNFVNQTLRQAALIRIEKYIEAGIHDNERDDLALNPGTFGGDALSNSPEIQQLVTASGLIPWVQQFFDKRVCTFGGSSVRVLPRFPAQTRKVTSPYHLDNIVDRNQGGGMVTFAALVAIYLSNVSQDPWRGNTVLYPPSHILMADRFQKEQWNAMYKSNGTFYRPKDFLVQEKQVRAGAGDVLLVHPLLLHGVAPNFGAQTRHAVFVHLYFADMPPPDFGGPSANDLGRLQTVQNLWHGWNISAVGAPRPRPQQFLHDEAVDCKMQATF